MTCSVRAVCSEIGMDRYRYFSSSPAVAAKCSYARAGVGVVAIQNLTDSTFGDKRLDLMETGAAREN